MNIEKILKKERLTRALTGFTPHEFNELLPTFEQVWNRSKMETYLENPKRKRKPGGGCKGFLPTIVEKFFFILFYYKCYPTYDVLSLFYDCNRANAYRRQETLSLILELTLGKKLLLPKRQIKSIDEFFQAFPEVKEVFIDGTERPIQRPKNGKKQKDNYSGKKKRHTRKNLIITDKKKRIGFLSKTEGGSKHDFNILKEQALPDHIPKKIKKHLDRGFQGFAKQYPGHCLSIPQRKPRTKELSPSIKKQNKRKSGLRIIIEHAIWGIKRFRITSDVFRNRKQNFDDRAILIPCGLWNYHLSMK